MNVFLRPEIANSYDDYYHSDFGKIVDRAEKEIVLSLLKDIPKEEVIELGCGTGHWTNYLIKQGFKVIGIDASEAMLNMAKSKGINAKFLLADSENLPFTDESYKIIVSITMLEFADNQDTVIQEMYRVLKKDGWLILGFLNAKSILGRNKEKDEIFKNANLLKVEDIKFKFAQFELKQIKDGIYLDSDYTIKDNANTINHIEPVFIGVLLHKK